MYSFRQIREAVLAGDRRPGFPFEGALQPGRAAILRAAPHLRQLLDEVRQDAARLRDEPIQTLPFSAFRLFEVTGTRKEYERPYFARRARLIALALAATLDQDDSLLPALEDTIWAICDEYTWCLPAHLGRGVPSARADRRPPEQVVDLFAAETSHALAETLLMLGERLGPWMHYRVRAEIERRIFLPLFHDPAHFFWESVPMNWASVCAGAAGMAALALEDDPERLAGMVERCCRAMECFMEGFGPDGGCAEGIGYWQYGFGYFVYFAEALREYTGGRLDLLDDELARRVAAFPAGVSLGGAAFVNYSDGQSAMRLAPGLVARLHRRVGMPLVDLEHLPGLHDDHAYRWPHVTRNLVWSEPQVFDGATPEGAAVFDHLGWVVDRKRVGGTMVAFSARGGNNAEPHNQNDLGHFIVHIGGESLLADLGAGLYTRQYFGPQRYEHIHNSSEGHSLPVIDGHAQQAGPERRAEVLACETGERGVTFELDLTRAYAAPSLSSFTRRFEWAHTETGATLVLEDDFAFGAAPRSLDELFVSLHRPELSPGRAVWEGLRGSVTLRYDAAAFDAELEEIASQNHQGEPIAVQRLRLRARQLSGRMRPRFVFSCSVG